MLFRSTTIACTEVVMDDATPSAIPIDDALILSDETPSTKPRQTMATATSVWRDECVRRRTHEKKTVNGSTSPRAICYGWRGQRRLSRRRERETNVERRVNVFCQSSSATDKSDSRSELTKTVGVLRGE